MAIDSPLIADKRGVLPAVLNGLKCRCPACGEGKLYRAFLKVNETCPKCGEVLSHHRADDFPPYIAIFIVGHLIVGWMLHNEMSGVPTDPMFYVYTMVPLAAILPLVMLPSIKGAVVGLQWANRMYGFDPKYRADEPGGN